MAAFFTPPPKPAKLWELLEDLHHDVSEGRWTEKDYLAWAASPADTSRPRTIQSSCCGASYKLSLGGRRVVRLYEEYPWTF